MIGQVAVLEQVKKQLNNFPGFLIFCAPDGYGKKTLCREIAEQLKCDVMFYDNKIESVRECIDTAMTQVKEIIYVLQDADSMSVSAKNSMLKLVEEPPRSAHIILLCADEQNLLPTIVSRGVILKFNEYTKDELREFYKMSYPQSYQQNVDNSEKIINLCNCPGDIIKAQDIDINKLSTFAQKVVDNLKDATISNALKITKQLKLSESDNGYDVGLFLNCVLDTILEEIETIITDPEEIRFLVEFSKVIVESKAKLSNSSINKTMLIDTMLIKGWEVWNYLN